MEHLRPVLLRVLALCAPLEAPRLRLVHDATLKPGAKPSAPSPGRRFEGFEAPGAPAGADPVGAFYASAAAFERASVTAFERLAAELRAHGAPGHLVARALAAADDERCHDRAMRALARRYGADVAPLDAAPLPVRGLAAVAVENVAEGCVRETWSALLAWWVASHAPDASAAATFRAVADDETRHADLAWDVAAWLSPRLRPAVRERVRRAGDATVRAVFEEAAAPMHPSARGAVGLPTPDEALGLAAELDAQLWSRAL